MKWENIRAWQNFFSPISSVELFLLFGSCSTTRPRKLCCVFISNCKSFLYLPCPCGVHWILQAFPPNPTLFFNPATALDAADLCWDCYQGTRFSHRTETQVKGEALGMWSHFCCLGTLAAMTLYNCPQPEHERSVEAVVFMRQFTIFSFEENSLSLYFLSLVCSNIWWGKEILQFLVCWAKVEFGTAKLALFQNQLKSGSKERK